MGNMLEVIAEGAKLCRENGVEPNRIRMGHASYYDFFLELAEKGEGFLESNPDIAGLTVEVWLSCPRHAIYVDRKPENEELGEMETRLRAKYGVPHAV